MENNSNRSDIMLICIKDCYPKYDSDGCYIRGNSLFSKYHRSIDPITEEPSWTIYSDLFPEICGIYNSEFFMELSDWRTLKIDQILC
jgi:hypothetical protein